MIEGLRVLPFWQTQIAESPQDIRRDCGTCMKSNDAKRRQLMGCGYEPRLPRRLGLWSPKPMIDDWNTTPPETREVDPVMHCAGYTTSLPEVVEVAIAYPQYEAGYLADFLGERPSTEMLYGCATLKRAHSAWEADRIRQQREEAKHGSR